jgi:ATP-dependent HslUV protease ATP-binding subunit HslU
LLFEAPDMRGQNISIDREYVEIRLKKIVQDEDLSRYIL